MTKIPDQKGVWNLVMWAWIIFGALTFAIMLQGDPDWWYGLIFLPALTGFIWGMAWLFRNNP